MQHVKRYLIIALLYAALNAGITYFILGILELPIEFAVTVALFFDVLLLVLWLVSQLPDDPPEEQPPLTQEHIDDYKRHRNKKP